MPFVRVNTDFSNTITEYSNSNIQNIQANEFEANVTYFFPPSQPAYFYRYDEVGMVVEENSQATINAYLGLIEPEPAADEPAEVTVAQFTAVTAATSTSVSQATFNAFTASTSTTDLAVLQISRTTSFDNIPTSWSDFTFDNTAYEPTPDIIEHDNTNTDRVLIKEDGVYLIGYTFSADDEGRGRVRLNDTSVITGSHSRFGPVADTDDLFGTAAASFVTPLTAGDFITLQVEATTTAENIDPNASLYVVKLNGVKGDKGDDGVGSTINVSQNGSLVTGSPFSQINFSGASVTAVVVAST
jgi:hypothetical protein